MADSDALSENKLLLVDTNCLIRIYHSALRPFLGAQAGDYRILTLKSLLAEVKESDRLRVEYAWLSADLLAEGNSGSLADLCEVDAAEVELEVAQLRPYANRLLQKYCLGRAIVPRVLSRRDVQLLATAIVLEATVATDEWALSMVIDDLIEDDSYQIKKMTSIEILCLLENSRMLTREQRIATIRSWLQFGENLPRDWRAIYFKCFQEAAPAAQ